MFPLPIFPTNGFDTSILTPVLIGMGYLSLFSETLGWPFVGLVVPGYLAAVGIAAPLSAVTIIGESFVTFLLSRLVGIWIPETSSWTVFFGRERFFLLIISSVVVRIASEGYVLPYIASEYGFAFASELYSIGLVLVPLVANSFWNIGFLRGASQMGVVAALTYATCKWVLLPATNLSLSRFELTYEAVALDFLASSKSYVILLSGTMLAARSNVRFGWDFNGILVPGLLTVAWYSPVKLVSTFIEAYLVAMIAKRIVASKLLQRALIEGPRRTVLVFIVGYCVKYLEGVGALFLFPGEEITDFYGFGYVLPSLLAVKTWLKGSPGKVLMPAFQVSLAGFLVGNAVGYLFSVVLPPSPVTVARVEAAIERRGTLGAAAVMHVAGARDGVDTPDTREGRAILALAAGARGRGRGVDFALKALEGEGLRVEVSRRVRGGDWWIVRRPREGVAGRATPLVAFTRAPEATGIVVATVSSEGTAIPTALAIAEALPAAAVLVFPRGAEPSVVEAWANAAEAALGAGAPVHVEALPSGAVRIDWPLTLDRRAAVAAVFGGATVDDAEVRAERDRALWEQVSGGAELRDLAEPWTALEAAFAARSGTGESGSADPDARRAVERVLAPAMMRWAVGDDAEPSVHARVVARMLGLTFARTTVGSHAGMVLAPVRPGEVDLLWLARRGGSSLAVSTPNLRVRGVWEASRFVADVAQPAHMVWGLRPGATSYYEAVHRRLLTDPARHVLVLRPILEAPLPIDVPVVLATGDVVSAAHAAPAWVESLAGVWAALGVTPSWYDGRREYWSLRGSTDQLIGAEHKLGKRRVVVAWMRGDLLDAMASGSADEDDVKLLASAGWDVADGSVVEALGAAVASTHTRCDWSALVAGFERFRATKNPYALRSSRVVACQPSLVRDAPTRRVYVIAHPLEGARAARIDGLGHRATVHSEREVALAVIAGAREIAWVPAP